MNPSRKPKLRKKLDISNRLAYLFLLGLLGFICTVTAFEADLEGRVALLRAWILLSAAIVAVSTPHVTYPDPDWHLIQLLNLQPRSLLSHHIRRWSGIVLLTIIPCFVLVFFDSRNWSQDLLIKTGFFFDGLSVILGICLYGFGRYATIGQLSQAWQEGKKGDWFRKLNTLTTTPVALPDGLVPPFLMTGRIFLVGVGCVAAGGYLISWTSGRLGWLPGLLLVAWSTIQLLRQTPVYDRHFFCTNAFYSEIYRSAGNVRIADRDPVTYHSLYWVPTFLRAHVWAGLLQLDRKLPLGRLIFLGHLGLWTLFYLDLRVNIITAYLLLFIVLKNAVIYLIVTPAFAPYSIHSISLPVHIRAMTRLMMNLRWTMSFLLSLVLVVLMKSDFNIEQAFLWTTIDIFFALSTAWLFTRVNHAQYERKYS